MINLQEEVDKLLCNAFIGICYAVRANSSLAWYIEDNEEIMVSVETLIDDLTKEDNDNDLQFIKAYKAKGITEVVLVRGW